MHSVAQRSLEVIPPHLTTSHCSQAANFDTPRGQQQYLAIGTQAIGKHGLSCIEDPERKWADKILMYLKGMNNAENADWQAEPWGFPVPKDIDFDWSPFVLLCWQ